MERKIGMLITLTRQHISRLLEKMLAEYGIDEFNGPQGRILYVLWGRDSISIQELANGTGLANATLTSMLDRMERGGLILRRQNPRSRREILVSLTEEARRLQAAYEAVSQRINQVYYRGFRPEEIEQYEAYLARILANLEECEKAHRRNES